jgi:hypothetical protein
MRVLVDTNVWISALINKLGFPARVLQALKEERFELIISQVLVEELREVLSRPRLRRYVEEQEAEELITLLKDRAIWVEPPGELRLCRDPDDDLALETALLGRAQYMVTRDDDLKRDMELLKRMGEQGVTVLSVSQFLALLK